MTRKGLTIDAAVAYAPSGLTGSVAASRYCGGSPSGAPTTGAHVVGDWVIDQTGKLWICTAAGTPGTWTNAGAGLTPASTVQTESGLDAGQVGTSTNYAREDHRHPITNLVDLSTVQQITAAKNFTGGGNSWTGYGSAPTTNALIVQNTAAADATNVVKSPGRIEFDANYWTGALSLQATGFIGMTVTTSGGFRRMIFDADGYRFGTYDRLVGTRTTTTQAIDTVDLGTFATTGGAIELMIHAHLAAPAAGTTASVTKVYELALAATMGTVNTWYLCLPVDASANAAASNDFALEVQRTAAGTFQFRFRQKSIGVAGSITWTAEARGDTAVTFTPSTTVTTAPAAVSTQHPSNSLVAAAGNIGIGTDAPTAILHTVGDVKLQPTTDSTGVVVQPPSGSPNTVIQMVSVGGTNGTLWLIQNGGGGGNVGVTDAGVNDGSISVSGTNPRVLLGVKGQASTLRITGTDVTIASGATLTMDGAVASGAWTNYTPVWTAATTNPSIGNGTLQGRYKVIGKTVFVQFNFVAGSTTNFGSGTWAFSLPVSMSTNILSPTNHTAGGYLRVARGGVGLARVVLITSAPTVFNLQTAGPSWTATALGTSSSFYASAVPGTWVSGDSLEGTFVYEAA